MSFRTSIFLTQSFFRRRTIAENDDICAPVTESISAPLAESVFYDQQDAARKWMRSLDERFSSKDDSEIDSHINQDSEVIRNQTLQLGKELLKDYYYYNVTSAKKTTIVTSAATAAIVMAMVEELGISFTKKDAPELPQFAENTLIFLLPRDRREEIMGDLEEDYLTNIVPKLGEKLARRWYWFQAFRTILQYNGLTARIIKIVEELKKSRS